MINATKAYELADMAAEKARQAIKDAAREYCETVIAVEIENAAIAGRYSTKHRIKCGIACAYVREYLTSAGYRVDRVGDSLDEIMIDWCRYRDDR